MISIDQERAAVVAAARAWLRTPFHHGARVKGEGVDCVNLVCAALEEAGVVERLDLPDYAPDWMLHCGDDRLIDGLRVHCDEVAGPPERAPLPGDVVAWRFGRAFAHLAIVAEWPTIIHAFRLDPVSPANADGDGRLVFISDMPGEESKRRPRRFFVLKRWAA